MILQMILKMILQMILRNDITNDITNDIRKLPNKKQFGRQLIKKMGDNLKTICRASHQKDIKKLIN